MIHDIKVKLYHNEINADQALGLMHQLISKRQDYN